MMLLAPDEPARPTSARWFIERSVLFFAEDQGCADREIAVGHTMPERRTVDTDWIDHAVLGGVTWAYYRNPWDANCEYRMDVRAYADQHVRPHDHVDRPVGVHPGEGFYLDLVDGSRRGPRSLNAATSYFVRTDVGPSTVRLSYWMLFPMNMPAGSPSTTHEGDWERVDILLRRDGDARYEPRAVRVGVVNEEGASGSPRDVPWHRVRHQGGATHPVLIVERGGHAIRPAGRTDRCHNCERWRTWDNAEAVRKQPWHGFGGAWGEPGQTGATTGPLGPHGEWAPDYMG